MSITTLWDNDEKSVIRLIVEGRWTWEEYQTAATDIIYMLEVVDRPVDFIVEVRTTYVPEGAVREFEQASVFLRHPQAGFAVFVGANNYLRQLVSLFCHLFPGRTLWMLFAATVNDARRLLAERPRFDQCNIAVFRAAKGLT